MSGTEVNKPLVGKQMSSEEQIYSDGMGFVVIDGYFSQIAHTEEIKCEYSGHDTYDLQGRAIIPGFVDAHTHLLWSGDRSAEMRMRQQGMSYADIAAAGGGIRYTVEKTRSTMDFEAIAESRIRTAISMGTTSIEVKSGYGLDSVTELRMLEAYSRMKEKFADMSIHITWTVSFTHLRAHET